MITRDAEYTAYNDLDVPFSIQHLQYFPDITQAEFDAIDLDAVLAESSTPPGILLSPDGGTLTRPGFPIRSQDTCSLRLASSSIHRTLWYWGHSRKPW